MSTSGDWLPSSRDARIAMANTWWDVLSQKGIAWGVIEQPEIVAFAALISDAAAANNAGDTNRQSTKNITHLTDII